MTLRMRYYLAIVALFAGLALANAVVVLTLYRGEMRWGLEQRALGAATSVAEFWPVLAAASRSDQERLLARFSERRGALSMMWFDSETEHPLLSSADVPLPPSPDAAQQALLDESGGAWQFIERSLASTDVNIGYAHVMRRDDSRPAVVAVAELDRSFRDGTQALLERLAWLSGGLLLAGAMVAEGLTRLARRELVVLVSAADRLTQGETLPDWRQGRISEVNDLGGTLKTMSSLLEDGDERTRRRFFDAETIPRDDQLAECYLTQKYSRLVDGELRSRIAWRVVGRMGLDDFVGCQQSAGGWHVAVGRCRSTVPPEDPTDRVLAADAACDYVLGMADGNGDLEGVREVFGIESVDVVFVPKGDARPSGRSLRQALGTWVPLHAREVLGTLSAEGLSIARMYAEQFADHAPEELATELQALLCNRFDGLLLVCDTRIG